RGRFDIRFSSCVIDEMQGSRSLASELCARLGVGFGQLRDDRRVTVSATSCNGMCDQGPAALANGRPLTKLSSERVQAIAGLIEADEPVGSWPAELFEVEDNVRRAGPLLSTAFVPGEALRRALEAGTEETLAIVDRSHLRGRGGAGFATATKWSLCRAAGGQHVVVCNADEGEPGTFKDRVLLHSHADRVVEGMTICAYVLGARQGFIYLRGEYRYLLGELKRTLALRREAGLLGDCILGQRDFCFDVEIRMGAGSYVCGEESALLESLEGKRGIPRARPPFPVTRGYEGEPTVVNNVETLAAAAAIVFHGSDWFGSIGTPLSTGSKLLSIAGDCARPGVYEYPMGASLRQVLADCGANDAQAVQAGGPSGSLLPASDFDREVAFEDVSTGGALMVFGRQRRLVEIVRSFARFFAHESCGFCAPCRVGTAQLDTIMERLSSGEASEVDLQRVQALGAAMKASSQCGLGLTAANAVLDLVRRFPEAYRERISDGEHLKEPPRQAA